ncbi:MAG: hypothetical protein GC206_00740 [Alphaproteobacteria bacterium]|nr:hypothetical protein [Alphaproteobacteria bacterium]
MRGWILAALALVGVGLMTFSFLKPGAPETAAPVEEAAAPMATPAEANQPPSVVAAPPPSMASAPPAVALPPAATPRMAEAAPAPTAEETVGPDSPSPADVVAAPPLPAPSTDAPAPPPAPPPMASAPAPAAPDRLRAETRPRLGAARSSPPPPAASEAAAPPPPVAEAAEAAPPAAAASTGSASEDERIIECARIGAWGVGGCPTQEDLVTRFSRAGSVAFTDPPTEMSVGRSYTVRAAAALGDALAEETVRQNAGADASVQSRAVQLLPSLEAELTGVGFDIQPLQREGSQALLTGRANEWAWEVRPTEGGERRLTLIVWGQLTLDSARMAPIRVQTIEHSVTVDVDLQTRAAQAVDWVAYHWEAGAGLGALGLAGFGWAAGRRRRRAAA